jgi:hypothetical protein
LPTFVAAGSASVAASTATATVSIPGTAQAGDLLIVSDTLERNSITAAITVGGSTTGVNILRDEMASANMAQTVVWKRLVAGDVGATIAGTTTATRRHGLSYLILRTAGDPILTTSPYQLNGASVFTMQQPSVTPAANNAMLVAIPGAVNNTATPFTLAFTVDTANGWTLRVSAGSSVTGVANAYSPIATKALTGGAGASQTGAVFTTDNRPSWMGDTIVVPAIVTPPTPVVTSLDKLYVIDLTSSTAGQSGALSYSVTQLSGATTTPVTLATGKYGFPMGPDATFWRATVAEAGGTSATIDFSAPPAGSFVEEVEWSGTDWVSV